MRRWIAVLWQASFVFIGAVLYFLFVLPRWNELTGDWSHGLGTAGRIVAGLLIGLAALPVTFTLLKTRKPEYGTPQLALTLRVWSVVLHVLAGVLIVGTAIAEIWLQLDSVGQWLFGIYGAAAAIALLGTFAFYLAFVAELPPPPPKPLKSKTRTRGRGRRKAADAEDKDDDDTADDGDDVTATSDEVTPEAAETDTETVETTEAPVAADVTETAEATDTTTEAAEAETSEAESGKLRNRRSSGKPSSRLRRRSRGGVALDD